MSVCLLACLYVCLLVCLLVSLSVYRFVSLTACLYVCLFVSPTVYLCVCVRLPVSPSVCLLVLYPSVRLSIRFPVRLRLSVCPSCIACPFKNKAPVSKPDSDHVRKHRPGGPPVPQRRAERPNHRAPGHPDPKAAWVKTHGAGRGGPRSARAERNAGTLSLLIAELASRRRDGSARVCGGKRAAISRPATAPHLPV